MSLKHEDINLTDSKLKSILHHACKRGYGQIVNLILQQKDLKININAKDIYYS